MGKNSLALKIALLLAVCAFGLAGISCKKENTATQPRANMPPEHEEMIQAFKKSAEVSKKIVVAKINGVVLTMSDLIREMNAVAPQYIKPGEKRDPKIDEKVRKEALDRLIDRELILQQAKKAGVTVPPETVEDALNKFKAGMKSEDAYREYLAQSATTEEELRDQIRNSFLVAKIAEEKILPQVKIDPKQVEKTYAKEKEAYRGPSGQMSLEEARPLIEQELRMSEFHKKEQAWAARLRKDAKIEITLDEPAKKEIHSLK